MRKMILISAFCLFITGCGGKNIEGGYSSTTEKGTGGGSIGGPTVEELEARLVKLRDVEYYAYLVYCRAHVNESPCTQAEADAAIEPINAGFRALTAYKARKSKKNSDALLAAVKTAEAVVAALPKQR